MFVYTKMGQVFHLELEPEDLRAILRAVASGVVNALLSVGIGTHGWHKAWLNARDIDESRTFEK